MRLVAGFGALGMMALAACPPADAAEMRGVTATEIKIGHTMPYSGPVSAFGALGKVDGGFAITKIVLTTTADVPGATEEVFEKAAADAKAGCPISKLFKGNTEITLDAQLV